MMDFLKSKDETKSIDRDVGFLLDTFGFVKDQIAFEEHCLNQFNEDGDIESLKDMAWMRKKRADYLALISKGEGNAWCKSKHLLRIAMWLQEDCARFLSINDMENAKRCAKDYGEVYLKFIKINGYTEEDLNKSESSA